MAKRRRGTSSALAVTSGNPVLGRTNGLAGQTGTAEERRLQAALGAMERRDRRNAKRNVGLASVGNYNLLSARNAGALGEDKEHKNRTRRTRNRQAVNMTWEGLR